MKQNRKKALQSILLAGGKGTRLRPLILTTPKPVVSLANRPFLSHQLDMIRRAGIRHVVLGLSFEDCVLWEGVEIGEGSRLKGCVLGRGASVGAHSHLSGHAVLGEGSVLPGYSRLTGSDAGSPA